MIGGSQAAVYYGEPRFTRDVDVVAGLGPAQIHALLARFLAPDFYVSGEAAREAVETRGQFNIIHPASGLKIDIFVNRDTPYDRLRLEPRRTWTRIGRSRAAARDDATQNFPRPQHLPEPGVDGRRAAPGRGFLPRAVHSDSRDRRGRAGARFGRG